MSINFNGLVKLEDSSGLDAFGRVRSSTPFILFDSQSQYNDGSNTYWENVLTGGGNTSHVANQSSVQMSVTTTSGDKVIRQSKQYFHYQPGKSQLIVFTAVLGIKKTNVRQRAGYFDSNNGVFFEQTSDNLKVVVRSYVTGTPVDTQNSQSEWNIDKLDGTGETGITLDMSKAQIFVIDFQWLGVGRIRFGFVINGRLLYCHQVFNANALNTVYMTTANLPVRFELENTGTSSSSTILTQICCMVASEGGFDTVGLLHSANNGITGVSVTTRRSVLTIRPKLTFNGITNRGMILPTDFDITVTTNNILFELVFGGTLGGSPSWTSAGTNSLVEYDVAGTTITGGEILTSGYVTASTSKVSGGDLNHIFLSKLPLSLNIAGDTQQILSLVATSFTGTANVNAAITWRELY